MLDAITSATGITLQTESLQEAGRDFLSDIADQVADNEELAKVISSLETRHDSYVQDNPKLSPFADSAGEIPNAESIAAELERFLRSRGASEE